MQKCKLDGPTPKQTLALRGTIESVKFPLGYEGCRELFVCGHVVGVFRPEISSQLRAGAEVKLVISLVGNRAIAREVIILRAAPKKEIQNIQQVILREV